MTLSSIPLVMVGGFLLLTLVVGLCASSQATTFRAYAVDNKRYSTALLTITLLATSIGGVSLLTNVIRVYHHGLHWMIHMLFAPIELWVINRVALRTGPLMEDLSIADTIGKVYGKCPRIITALSSIFYCLFIVTIQIDALSLALTMCIDAVDSRLVTILATLTLVAYATFGGIRAITITDVLQFITFTVIIFMLAKLMFSKTGKSILEIASFLHKQEKFQLSGSDHLQPWNLFLLVLHHCAFIFDPILTQRIYMSSSPIQAKKVFLYASFLQMPIFIAIMLIGLFFFVNHPGLALSETKIWTYIMTHLPPAFKGCIAISILGMAMSTADSSLHVCSVLVGHDMMESIRGITGPTACAHQIRLAKLTSIVTSLLAMIIVFYAHNLLELLISSMELYESIVIAPLILAILGFRGSARTALIGMATGALTILAWNKWVIPSINIEGDFFCIVANGLAMMAAHYLLRQPANKGWTGLDHRHKRMQQLIQAFKKYKKD